MSVIYYMSLANKAAYAQFEEKGLRNQRNPRHPLAMRIKMYGTCNGNSLESLIRSRALFAM